MKKNSNSIWIFFWIVVFITLFIVNLKALSLIVSAFTSPFGFLVLALPYSDPYFFTLAIIDLIAIIATLLFIYKQHSLGTATVIIYTALIFPSLYIYFSFMSFMLLFPTLIPNLSREEAIKQVNTCNVSSLTRDSNLISNKIVTRIEFEGRKAANRNYVANSDFDALLDAARAVQDRCGYEFEGFVSGIEGFKKEGHGIYITIDQTSELLSSCTIKSVNYLTPDGPLYNYNDPTGLPTGIILWPKEKPLEIYIEEDLISQMFPIAREAKNKCPDLEIEGVDLEQ